MTTKAKPGLGFDLADLESQVVRYDPTPTTPASQPGRRPLAPGARPVTIRLTPAQHEWALREAAHRTLQTGERHDVSRVIRDLLDRAISQREEGGG